MAKTPDKARNIDRFARYYLPEMVRLMGAYAELEKQGVKGDNADQIEADLRAATPIPPPPPLKTCWTRCTAPRQWIFRPTSRYWTAS